MHDAYFPGGSVKDKISNALFITECAICGKQLLEHGICDNCNEAVELSAYDSCNFELSIEDFKIECAACYSYDSARIVDLLFHLKRKGGNSVISFASRKIMRAVNAVQPEGYTIFTNVPRSTSGKHKYGFDQSELIAKKAAVFYNSCIYRKLLKRKGFSAEQKNLNIYDRKNNSKGKFRICRQLRKINPDSIVIFDDVITTGSSISECASQLHRAFPDARLCAVFLARA